MTVAMLPNHPILWPFDQDVAPRGHCARNWVERADGTRQALSATDRTEMQPGDVFVIETPGGGGNGAVE